MQNQQTSLEEIRRRIEHEDNLLNQRVSWIVSSQPFLLTGYAILTQCSNLNLAMSITLETTRSS